MEKNDSNDTIQIICPSPEELSVIINDVKCDECKLSFRNESRLRMHVLKIHERKKLERTAKENVRYHCPDLSCVYSTKSQRYFASMKYVKQHYLKVHAAKKFACALCDKSFSTQAARDAHSRICGVQFTCSCLRVFGTYEALLTHGKRAAHSIDEKYKNIITSRRIGARGSPLVQRSRPVPILPQCASITLVDRSVGSSLRVTLDVAVQTDDPKRHKRTPSPSKTSRRRESRQTQTSALAKKEETRQSKTVETQTSEAAAALLPEGANGSNRKPTKRSASSKRNASLVRELAFTENYGNEHLFPGSPLQLQHDVRLQDFWERNASLGTQTSPEKDLLGALNESAAEQRPELGCLAGLAYAVESIYPFNNHPADASISRSDPMLTLQTFTDRFSSIETQTETGYSFDSDVALSANFAVSSNFAETQTTENFHNMEQLLYSNTCTQTCNDILPSDLGLSDIQTQTAWPELGDGTVAAETQTRDAASTCRSWLNIRTSQTQTDLLSMFDEFQ